MKILLSLIFWTCALCAWTEAHDPRRHPRHEHGMEQNMDTEGEEVNGVESSAYGQFQRFEGTGQRSGPSYRSPQSLSHFDTPSFFSHQPRNGHQYHNLQQNPNNFNNFRNSQFHQRSTNFQDSSEDNENETDPDPDPQPNRKSSGNKIHKFISIHVAPPEDESAKEKPKPIKVPSQKGEKHYQIVFIKAPSPPTQEMEEVQLPPLPETKTLVYVLLKKGPPPGEMIRIKGPPTQKPTPPQVFFIRYKGQGQGKGQKSDKASGVGSQQGGDDYEEEENLPGDEGLSQFGHYGGGEPDFSG